MTRTVRAALVFALIACGPAAMPMMERPNDDAPPTSAPEPDAGAPLADSGTGTPPADAGAPPRASGTLEVLTYNVAGLPEGLSSSKPATNTPLMSPKLNPFALVLAQEDFSYHRELVSAATHAYILAPKAGSSTVDLGDGLAILSRATLGTATHVKWNDCNGVFDQKNDCLTSKGFLYTTLELAPGVLVDVYDLHADAGRTSADAAAREKQARQLVAFITSHSAGRAVIVAGDTNMKDTDEAQLQLLLTGAGLTDACRALSCADPYRYDRVMFKSSAEVTLSAATYAVDLSFVDSSGAQLSDHEPVAVGLSWSAR